MIFKIFGKTSVTSSPHPITASSGTMFYDYIPIPRGPGVDQLAEILQTIPPLNIKVGPWMAGGAPRRLLEAKALDIENGDLDIFFDSEKNWKQFDAILSRYKSVHRSSMASTYLVEGLKVQLIKRRFYDTLDDVFRDFDFSACQIASDGGQLALTTQARKDIESSTLRFAPQGRVSKRTVVGRMVKYLNHGFIPEAGMFKLILDSGLDVVSAQAIFEKDGFESFESGNHDSKVDDMVDAMSLDAQILRDAAARLGVEYTND